MQVLAAALPAVILVLTIPLVRTRLDAQYFAAFTILVSAVGLLAVLDGGLGRASTYFASLEIGRGTARAGAEVFSGFLAVGIVFSLAVMLVVACAVFQTSSAAIQAARPSILVLVGFVPMFVAGSLLRGVLEAEQRFARSSGLQLAHGIVISAAPAVLIMDGMDLPMFAWTVGVARTALTLTLLRSTGLKLHLGWSTSVLEQTKRVIAYSKWLLVSNIIGLAIIFADRFVVANYFPNHAVAAYVLPMEVIGRLQILVAAFCTVVFPRLVIHASASRHSGRQFVENAQGAVMALTGLAGFAIAPFAHSMADWWLGASLAGTGGQVLLIGIVGLGLSANAALAMLDINSRGHTRPVAVLHTFEAVTYLACLSLAAHNLSVGLLLMIWTARLLVDAIGMNLVARSGLGEDETPPRSRQSVVAWVVVATVLALLLVIGYTPGALSASQVMVSALIGTAVMAIAGRHFFNQMRLAAPARQHPGQSHA